MPVLSTLGAAIANVYGFTSGLIKDQYFNLVSLLLPGNGTNGAQNNTFLDSGTANSGSGFTITRNGNTTQGTFSPFSQTGWGNYFDGSNDYVSMPDSTAFTMGNGDFTIECWVYKTTSGRQYITGQSDSTASSGSASFELSVNASNKLVGSVTVSTTTYSATSTADFPLNTWKHVAFVRNSGTTRLYIGGEQDGTNATLSTNSINDSANQVAIGRLGEYNGLYWNGYISNFRITKGGCLYPNGTTFTPSITPLTTTVSSGTVSLLTCQNNRFIDNAATPNTLTPNNGAAITPFSPFAPTQSYSAAAVGGSGYFDGTGDYLNSTITSLSDFTIEVWAYFTQQNSQTVLTIGDGNTASGVELYTGGSGFITAGNSTGSYISSVKPNVNSWTHLAITRSGSTLTLYVNGVSLGTANMGSTALNTTLRIGVEYYGATLAQYFIGYIGSLRISNSVRSGLTTIPTSPYSSDANTTFLLNFTNAGVVDATAKNVLETVGNAQISTTQSKWGGGSMYFDGTGDWLYGATNNPMFGFGTGNFTIEFWAWKSANGSAGGDGVISVVSGSTNQWYLELSSDRGFIFWNKTTAQGCQNNTTTGINDSTWHHWAVCRSGSTWYLFKDGVALTKTTDAIGSSSISGGTIVYIGNGKDTSDYPFNGYIDDLRVTKGYARYTANFTPPSAPFPVQ